ncbi:MarR family winged helix-turn-helix transcriptional regulator [Streptococcus cuniculipharyngis]|uniref:MarR family transcriptional regulator n=1 Tax=Streptococcus cuniculipharyngis TaxID=1562651 RepID=A0A5C5SAX6_9STRE|nr:MarR family transcriptional regulator [Streptococcus cuniculipharyngis]TWS96124.1 MarR family transcriptional regulator [Streptococcus cuniculipharyngis]
MNQLDQERARKAMIVFRKAQRTIDQQVSNSYKNHGITPTQFNVLEVLYNKGQMKICHLISKIFATSGNMTVVLRNMEKNGWIYRQVDPQDRRASLIGLTPQGESLIKKALPEHLEAVYQTMSILSPQEQDDLITLLKNFKKL